MRANLTQNWPKSQPILQYKPKNTTIIANFAQNATNAAKVIPDNQKTRLFWPKAVQNWPVLQPL